MPASDYLLEAACQHQDSILMLYNQFRDKKPVWLANVSHPALTPIIESLWKLAPPEMQRSFPSLPPWSGA